MPPLSLYIHLPWCVRKCPYCDFNSYTAGDDVPRRRYVDALLADLGLEAHRAAGRSLTTIFLGGGTPSFFPPEDIASILAAVRREMDVAADAEITMEANPGTVESGAPAGYRDAGVNRLSLGAQSFNADMLASLGRIHSVDDIQRSFEEARAAGFDNINLDVMTSLPGQDVVAAMADLEAAIALGPEHLSWYQLTLEPNTVFHARPPGNLPDDETAWEIQQQGQAVLEAAGFRQYEVSAWAQPGRECRHNLNYWRFGDYLAVGAGAHGKVTADSEPLRYQKPANPLGYMAAMERGQGTPAEVVAEKDRVFEFALMATRLVEGFSEAQFEASTGLAADVLRASIQGPIERGLMSSGAPGTYRPTPLGRRFLNDLQAGFLP